MSLYAQILNNRQLLTVEGEESQDFLQGLITNDVRKCSENHALFAAMLTPKGRYAHDFILLKHKTGFFLDVSSLGIEDLRKRLSVYKLRRNIILEKTAAPLSVMAVWGDANWEPGQHLINPGDCIKKNCETIILRDPRTASLGWRMYAPIKILNKFMENIPSGDYTQHRFSLGIGEYGSGLVQDKTIPLEANFDRLNAIDWHKGCYIGQELTARTYHQGLVRKRLTAFRVNQDNVFIKDEKLYEYKDSCDDATNIGTVLAQHGGIALVKARLTNQDE